MEKGLKKQPLYNQLVDLLKEKIEMEMEANDMLPSERDLTNRYGLSRTTVRLALQELEKQGYIYRQHGKGTFVSDLSKQATNLSGTYSFTEQMISLGKVPITKILEFKVVEANKYLASQLSVSLGERLYKLKRLRSADGQAMMVERSYLPVKKFMTLTQEMLEQKPLYDLFSQDFEQKIRIANEEFFASIAKAKDAAQLEIPEGSPVLNLVRTTYNTENEIIEFTLSVARADQFRYKITHVRHQENT
ncbi:GntR family transcriptional regulator [Enterococcus lemanii]|uniref:GntR family transcriptional regulator n=1 Tax=Enterococcus lemanii TaxID=1159752 RepID=A0ABV9MRT5_9ENTE|nr:GntR family transcriptional regulator [Enterococcus lemanii]MBM7709127.1 GntR family transcriptional regulator [Enterococcus lemanii]